MRDKLRKLGVATALIIAVAGTTVSLPDAANARWGGGWHGGGWHGGGWHGGRGGWGWGAVGVGVGTGLLLGAAAAAPYYGGYYGYGPYAYDDGYAPAYAAYGGSYGYGDCYIRGRWVWDGYGHRVWRRVRVCY
jgi:hypothetical protein